MVFRFFGFFFISSLDWNLDFTEINFIDDAKWEWRMNDDDDEVSEGNVYKINWWIKIGYIEKDAKKTSSDNIHSSSQSRTKLCCDEENFEASAAFRFFLWKLKFK